MGVIEPLTTSSLYTCMYLGTCWQNKPEKYWVLSLTKLVDHPHKHSERLIRLVDGVDHHHVLWQLRRHLYDVGLVIRVVH